jgi:hypothetical protein
MHDAFDQHRAIDTGVTAAGASDIPHDRRSFPPASGSIVIILHRVSCSSTAMTTREPMCSRRPTNAKPLCRAELRREVGAEPAPVQRCIDLAVELFNRLQRDQRDRPAISHGAMRPQQGQSGGRALFRKHRQQRRIIDGQCLSRRRVHVQLAELSPVYPSVAGLRPPCS